MLKNIAGSRFLIATVVAVAFSLLVPDISTDWSRRKLYLTLVSMRRAVPARGDLLIVEIGPDNSSETIEPSLWVEFFLTLVEMRADKVLILFPTEALGSAAALAKEKYEGIRHLFNEEFSVIDGNITALFEAILLGSIRPAEFPRFVE